MIWSGRRGSNPRPSPWQGDTLPLSYFRSYLILTSSVPSRGVEPRFHALQARAVTTLASLAR